MDKEQIKTLDNKALNWYRQHIALFHQECLSFDRYIAGDPNHIFDKHLSELEKLISMEIDRRKDTFINETVEVPSFIRMEIVLSEEKGKLHGIDIKKGYEILDKHFVKRGVTKIGEGIYESENKQEYFNTFSIASAELPDSKWFPKVVEKWLWFIDGEIEDCMEIITGEYNEVGKRPSFIRMEIVLSEEKGRLHGIDIKKAYELLDKHFMNRGVIKISEGVYESEDEQKYFDAFSIANAKLPRTDWFPKVVEKWLWYIDDEVEDCIAILKGKYF